MLDDGSSTYMHAATASVSAIDLSICVPNIFLYVQWKVHEDLCVSDHHPITIFYDLVNTSYATPSWKLCKANWDHFAECASKHLGSDNSDISVEDFSKKLIDIATYTIPRSKPSVRKRNTIWFNDQCKEARSSRKKAWRKVKSNPTDDNIQRYKIIRAKSRRTIKTARRQSCHRFVSSINSRTSL